METYTEKALKAIATGNAPAEQAALEAVIAEAVKKAVKETRRQDQQQALHNTALLIYNIVLSTRTEWNEELEELPPRYEEYKAALANK